MVNGQVIVINVIQSKYGSNWSVLSALIILKGEAVPQPLAHFISCHIAICLGVL